MSKFLTFLPLAEPVHLSETKLFSGATGTYLGQPFLLESVSSDDPDKEARLVKVNGFMFVIMNMGFPLPFESYEEAVQIDNLWPEAKTIIDTNKSHIILSVFEKPTSPCDLLNAAKAMALFAAYLCDLLPIQAKLTADAKTVASPKQVRLEAEYLGQDNLPISWTSFQYFNGGLSHRGDQKIVTVSNGLKPFIGRELETPAMEGVTEKTSAFLFDLAIYLIKNGLIVKHGDTVGQTEGQMIKVFHKPSGLREDTPILLVEFSSTEEEAFKAVAAQEQAQPAPLVRRPRRPFGKRNR
ncbi:hypothetical protein PSE_1584 [Pseudovibrio sp. FO-BEG1]|uniref:DUF4261 domain-containing protein n=1 Tax=Pseudovibrio sp. (strain FO-BEG1) TaxID=911045 RepID=UPI000238C569|nr:DUF4261 domain-containing protein [Pseudovibrio sp. FO-BEG1]AEV36096.1 hypothetical protein PSE_1584 [Pseudovibrio sp. FO-BEG1]